MIDRTADVYALDQQGGKGGANYQKNVMCTILSDSHGTPHAIAYKVVDAYGFDSYNQDICDEMAQTIRAGPGGECVPKCLIRKKGKYKGCR